MDILINKGGFRERANRSHQYKDSENEKTTLNSNKYRPPTKSKSDKSEEIQKDNLDDFQKIHSTD